MCTVGCRCPASSCPDSSLENNHKFRYERFSPICVQSSAVEEAEKHRTAAAGGSRPRPAAGRRPLQAACGPLAAGTMGDAGASSTTGLAAKLAEPATAAAPVGRRPLRNWNTGGRGRRPLLLAARKGFPGS